MRIASRSPGRTYSDELGVEKPALSEPMSRGPGGYHLVDRQSGNWLKKRPRGHLVFEKLINNPDAKTVCEFTRISLYRPPLLADLRKTPKTVAHP